MSFLLRRSSGKSKDGKQRRRTASGKDFTITKGTGSLQITRSNGRPASLYEASENATWESTVSAKLKDSLPEQEHKRQRVIFELIETEKSFIQDLWVMKSHFRKELETSKCITDKEITMIFSNLDDVIKTNELLYSKVVARRKDGKGVVKKIADIFVDMFGKSKGFNSYVEYCANQLPAQEMYNSLIRTNPQFLDVMKKM